MPSLPEAAPREATLRGLSSTLRAQLEQGNIQGGAPNLSSYMSPEMVRLQHRSVVKCCLLGLVHGPVSLAPAFLRILQDACRVKVPNPLLGLKIYQTNQSLSSKYQSLGFFEISSIPTLENSSLKKLYIGLSLA